MKQAVSFEVNNGCMLELVQDHFDGDVYVHKYDGEKKVYGNTITAGDMVMLFNLYRYIKDNDIQNDFINPYGANKE